MGKKILLTAFFAATFAFSTFAEEQKPAGENTEKPVETRVQATGERSFWTQLGRDILLYIPNRIIDASDLISMRVGAGAPFAIQAQVTNMLQFGGTHSSFYFLEKGYKRQCGGGYGDGSSFGLLMFDYQNKTVTETTGSVQKYALRKEFGIADPMLSAYADDKVDFWSIGADIGFVLGLGVHVHLRELPDFIGGIFFFDLSEDDLK